MNRQRSLIEYARPVRTVPPRAANTLVILAASMVIGLLSARPFADAVGLPHITDPRAQWGYTALRMACAGVVVFAAAVCVSLILRGIQALATTLANTSARPPFPVALAMVTAGPICILAALTLPLYMGLLTGADPDAAVHVPVLAQLLAVLTFLVGVGLLAVGVWASLRPSHASENGRKQSAAKAAADKSIFAVLQSQAQPISERGLGFGRIEMHEVER